jgi:hypothetical protein
MSPLKQAFSWAVPYLIIKNFPDPQRFIPGSILQQQGIDDAGGKLVGQPAYMLQVMAEHGPGRIHPAGGIALDGVKLRSTQA